MKRNYVIANSVLWAAAIIAAAVVGAPGVLTIVLLPALASVSLLMTQGKPAAGCRA